VGEKVMGWAVSCEGVRVRVRVRFLPRVRVRLRGWDWVEVGERMEEREEGSVTSYCAVLSWAVKGWGRRLVAGSEFERLIAVMGTLRRLGLELELELGPELERGKDSTGCWKRAVS
jgi:hypothetical protein